MIFKRIFKIITALPLPIVAVWWLVAVWMAVIFALSAQPANVSNKLSSNISKAVVDEAQKAGIMEQGESAKKEAQKVKLVNAIMREAAHATVFLVLGFLVCLALRTSRVKGFRGFAYAYLFCIMYAWSDEIHQLFVPGRAAEFIDLSLDFAGALIGILLAYPSAWLLRTILLKKKTA